MLKKIGMLIAVSALIAGCAGSAMPNFYKGHYYMAGGPGCTQWRELSGTRMMCIDSDGNDNGYIVPMTDQQLEMYRHKQTMQSNSYNNNNNNYDSGPVFCNTIGTMTFCN
jgi:hypothetical protein